MYQNKALGVVRETLVGVANDDSVYQLRLSDRNRTASFGAGIGFNVGVAITDYISLKYGYEALFLTNMAFGPDQTSGLKTDILGNTRFNVVNNGLFIAHGGNIGLRSAGKRRRCPTSNRNPVSEKPGFFVAGHHRMNWST